MNVSGFILIGGQAKRLGNIPKGLLTYQGKTFVDRIAEAMKPFVEQCVLVGHSTGNYSYRVYHDRVKGKGPLGGIYTALQLSTTPLNLIVACDMPFVSKELFAWLLHHAGETQVVLPTDHKGLQPLCALYHRNCLPILKQLLRKKTLSLRTMLCYLSYKALPLTPQLPFYTPHLLFNVNTFEDKTYLQQL